MSPVYLLSVIVIGLSGIVAQVMLLRELLVSFYGNELTLGLILANWIMAEAIGVFIIGRLIDKIKNKVNVFILLETAFCVALPLSVYFSRTVKAMLGLPFGEGIGLSQVFYSSLLIMLPVAFCHGALFSCCCKIYSSYIKDPVRSVGRIYAWETIGTILGGVLLTYFFIPRLDSFRIVFAIVAANLVICLFFFRGASRIFKYLTLFLILLAAYIASFGVLDKITGYSIMKQWRMQQVLDYRNSIYGNIAVIQKEEQRTFFYNGIPIITTPYPDIAFVQDFANLPLLFHPQPKDVLIISGGAGGLISEILKYPVSKIDYAELDPLIIEMLKRHPSALTERELNDKRVNVINKDGRYFVKNSSGKYDVVLIGSSSPADLSTNRVFTREFFALAKKRLNRQGLLALYLPGSLTYLSNELRDINASILNGLKDVYGYVRIIPGDYNIFLASDSEGITEVEPSLISLRLSRDNIKAGILVPAYLEYRLDKKRVEWFTHSSRGATKKVNSDFMPAAVYHMSVLWNKQFSAGLARILRTLEGLDLKLIFAFISALTLLLFFILYRKEKLIKLSVAYSVATTGFFAMLINLVLIFAFQVTYGYLYHKIGLLISVFMAGTACGSIIITRKLGKIKRALALFINLEVLTMLFSYLTVTAIPLLSGYADFLMAIFMALFFISGMLIGLEFPLAVKLYLREKGEVGFTSGLLYFSDLIGGWFAGIIGAVVFLPVLGLFNTCMAIVFLKLSSLLLLLIFSKRLTA